jgi:hypothetical protein
VWGTVFFLVGEAPFAAPPRYSFATGLTRHAKLNYLRGRKGKETTAVRE